MQINPASGIDHDFSHIDSLDFIRLASSWLRASWGAFGFVVLGLRCEQIVFAEQSVDAFFVNQQTLSVAQISPNTFVAPGRMLGFNSLNFP